MLTKRGNGGFEDLRSSKMALENLGMTKVIVAQVAIEKI